MRHLHSTKCLEIVGNDKLCEGAEVYEEILNQIEEVVDKIRYAGHEDVEKIYVKELLSLFAADSGRFIRQLKK